MARLSLPVTKGKRALLGIVVAVAVLLAWWGIPNRPPRPIVRTFSSAGVSKLVVRAAGAEAAAVTRDAGATTIEIHGTPYGGTEGYHPAWPFWRETPARAWGLDFVAAKHGDVLVVSTKNELEYIHHHYLLRDRASAYRQRSRWCAKRELLAEMALRT